MIANFNFSNSPSKEAYDVFNEALDEGVRFTIASNTSDSDQIKSCITVNYDEMKIEGCKTQNDVSNKRSCLIVKIQPVLPDIHKIMIVMHISMWGDKDETKDNNQS